MPLQGEYAPSSAQWVREQVQEYEGSGGTKGTTLRGVPTIVVTSMGAGSGKLRKNPVMRVEHDGSYAAVASKGGAPEHPAWYRNLPRASARRGPGRDREGRLHRPRGSRVTSARSGGSAPCGVARLRRVPDQDRARDPGVRARARA